jgi:hypothetical protein
MLERQILYEADGLLSPGQCGEKLYGRKNFFELYAVFTAPPVMRVQHGKQDVGYIQAMEPNPSHVAARGFEMNNPPARLAAKRFKSNMPLAVTDSLFSKQNPLRYPARTSRTNQRHDAPSSRSPFCSEPTSCTCCTRAFQPF